MNDAGLVANFSTQTSRDRPIACGVNASRRARFVVRRCGDLRRSR